MVRWGSSVLAPRKRVLGDRWRGIVLSLTLSTVISSCTANLTLQDPQKTYDQATQALVAGDNRLAVEKLSQIIVKTPEFAEAYVNRGSAYDGLGEYGKAIADYSQAIEINPQLFDAYFNRGNSQARLGDFPLAKADFDRAIELKPMSGEAHGNRAMLQLELDDTAAARADLQKAIALFKAQGNKAAQTQAEQQLSALHQN